MGTSYISSSCKIVRFKAKAERTLFRYPRLGMLSFIIFEDLRSEKSE